MRVAITGGIGSGKSYVCQLLAKRGIRIYDCDAAAKRLMREHTQLQQALCKLVGNTVYSDGVLQKAVLAKFLLQSENNKQAVNDVVHPAVARDFMASGYAWLESAILFESRFNERVFLDFIVCVSAPLEVRIRRIMSRDGISREKTLDWINRQMAQEIVAERSDYVIENDGRKDLEQQIDELLKQINNK
jgi:dephospho-CoA kinase